MNRFISILLLLPLLFSCAEEEFGGERPDERLSQTLTDYYAQLSGATHGWKGHLFTNKGNGGGYGFLLRFDQHNRVHMLADINTETGSQPAESSYRIKAALLPTLYFDTYSYIHLLSDPDPSVNAGEPGWGQRSDFEFSFRKVSADTIRLKGTLSDSELTLIRATAEEAAAYEDGSLNSLKADLNNHLSSHLFNYLQRPSQQPLAISFNDQAKTVSLLYDSAGVLLSKNIGFALSAFREIVLAKPIELAGFTFHSLQLAADGSQLVAITADGAQVLQSAEEPIYSFYRTLGVQFNALAVQIGTDVPGSGAAFNARRQQFLDAGERVAPGLTFPQMNFIFNKKEQSLLLQVVVMQNGNVFYANYSFTYSLQGEAMQLVYVGPLNANASSLEQAFTPIIQGLLSGPVHFGYAVQAGEVLGKGTVEQLPGFTFIGHLVK